MQPFISVFGLTLQAAPLAIMAGYLAAAWLAVRYGRRFGLDGDVVGDALFYAALIGLLAARAGYVAMNVEAYSREPLSALAPSVSGLAPGFGLAAAGVFALFWLWRKRQLRVRLPDALAVPACVFAIGLACASYFDGTVYGGTTSLPWAVDVWGALRHPVQFYEAALTAVLAATLALFARRDPPQGALALGFVAGFAAIRAAVDGFRADDAALVFGMRATQVGAAVIAAAALWLLCELLPDPAKGP